MPLEFKNEPLTDFSNPGLGPIRPVPRRDPSHLRLVPSQLLQHMLAGL